MSATDVEITDDVLVLRKEDAERIQQAVDAGKPAKPSAPPPPPPKPVGTTTSPPPPPVSTRNVPGFSWEGDVPWQKWTQFYNKVVSRFSTKGAKLRVTVEVAPSGGVSEHEVQETRTALKELGLDDRLQQKKP